MHFTLRFPSDADRETLLSALLDLRYFGFTWIEDERLGQFLQKRAMDMLEEVITDLHISWTASGESEDEFAEGVQIVKHIDCSCQSNAEEERARRQREMLQGLQVGVSIPKESKRNELVSTRNTIENTKTTSSSCIKKLVDFEIRSLKEFVVGVLYKGPTHHINSHMDNFLLWNCSTLRSKCRALWNIFANVYVLSATTCKGESTFSVSGSIETKRTKGSLDVEVLRARTLLKVNRQFCPNVSLLTRFVEFHDKRFSLSNFSSQETNRFKNVDIEEYWDISKR